MEPRETIHEPDHDIIVLEAFKPALRRTAGGLVIPASAEQAEVIGIVLAVGPGVVTTSGARVEPRLKRGDLVFYSAKHGLKMPDAGHESIFVHYQHVLSRVKDAHAAELLKDHASEA